MSCSDNLVLGKSRSKMRYTIMASTVTEQHAFEIPTKLIKTVDDMPIWEKSEAYYQYLGFILAINDAVKGKSNSKGSENMSPEAMAVVNLLNKLDARIDDNPPIQQPQRFGNMAFRDWYTSMRNDSLMLLEEILPEGLYKCIPEIVSYLVEGFGNSTRIDYGTGHEISFIMFLCCLFKIGCLADRDRVAVGCAIFPRYLALAQKLQKTYRMEPAGSHGVWSLDDYQFVPFIWGSSQLFAHPRIEPAAFLQPNILNNFADDYMFLTCIRYINTVKTGPFAEHSNQLWSISGVSSWSKINSGLVKMYKAEVLCKFPVAQHIVFGSLFTLKAVEQTTGLMAAKTRMVMPPTPFVKPEDVAFGATRSVSSTVSDGSSTESRSGNEKASECYETDSSGLSQERQEGDGASQNKLHL